MAGSGKCDKNPRVVVEELESNHSDEEEDESVEEAAEEVEIKDEVDDDDNVSDSPVFNAEGEKLELVDEIKEEDINEDITSDIENSDVQLEEVKEEDTSDISEDSDVQLEEDTSDISEDSDVQLEEVKEGDLDEDTSSDISEDSDAQLENSDDENPKPKEKMKKKGEKHVTIMAEGNGGEGDQADDAESDNEDDNTEIKDEPDADESKSGLANVMAKILAIPGGNNVMLSKARKDYEVKNTKETGEFEFVDAEGNVKKEIKFEVKEEEDEEEKARIKKRMKEAIVKKLKLKPDLEADREKEKRLRVISTQGVVQLFTAIEKHKSNVQKMRSKTKSLIDRDTVSSDLKETFYDILEKEGEKMEKPLKRKKVKSEAEDGPISLPVADKKPKWSVFADNFYKEPTLQGWDVQSDEND